MNRQKYKLHENPRVKTFSRLKSKGVNVVLYTMKNLSTILLRTGYDSLIYYDLKSKRAITLK
jgi:hypothetical protein